MKQKLLIIGALLLLVANVEAQRIGIKEVYHYLMPMLFLRT